jgi:hypothetical protein
MHALMSESNNSRIEAEECVRKEVVIAALREAYLLRGPISPCVERGKIAIAVCSLLLK